MRVGRGIRRCVVRDNGPYAEPRVPRRKASFTCHTQGQPRSHTPRPPTTWNDFPQWSEVRKCVGPHSQLERVKRKGIGSILPATSFRKSLVCEHQQCDWQEYGAPVSLAQRRADALIHSAVFSVIRANLIHQQQASFLIPVNACRLLC